MIHQPLAGMEGTATELEIHAKEVLRIKQMMNELLLKHTGQTLTNVRNPRHLCLPAFLSWWRKDGGGRKSFRRWGRGA